MAANKRERSLRIGLGTAIGVGIGMVIDDVAIGIGIKSIPRHQRGRWR